MHFNNEADFDVLTILFRGDEYFNVIAVNSDFTKFSQSMCDLGFRSFVSQHDCDLSDLSVISEHVHHTDRAFSMPYILHCHE